MDLAANPFTHAIAAGQKQIGLWISLSSHFAAEVVAPAGYDWALIDMEHSPNDYFSTLGQLQTFAASDTTAIVRVEWNDAQGAASQVELNTLIAYASPLTSVLSQREHAISPGGETDTGYEGLHWETPMDEEDVPDPRGGVRWIIPDKANYWGNE